MESECIAELNPSASCWPLTRCLLIYQQTSANQNTVHLKTGFIWKFSREWLFSTGYASGGSLRKKIANCETRKTGVLARWLFAFVFKDLCTENRGKLPRKISRQRKNRDFSILNSRAPSQNNKTSRTSCRRLFENFLPSTPTEVTFEISVNLARS